MGRRKKTFFDESLRTNTYTYIQYLDRLIEIALATVEWQNLPPTVDERFLELTLMSEGKCLFFEDEVMGYLTLQFNGNGNWDVYREPLTRRAYAVNSYQIEKTAFDSVIIWNNYTRQNSYSVLTEFAKRLYNLDRVIDVNSNAQKTPVLIQGSDKEKLSLLNLYKEYDGNAPVIFAYDSLNTDGLKVLKTDAPYISDKIYELKTKIWNEALTYLGVANLDVIKKERVIKDEVNQSMGGVYASRKSRIKCRQQACEKINKMFGLNIWCDFMDEKEEDEEDILIEEERDNKNE